MQTRKDRLTHLYNLIEFDISIIQDKFELLKRLAATEESDWTEQHEYILNKLENSCVKR